MEHTVLKEQVNEKIDSILEIKYEIENLKMDLESEKEALLNTLRSNNIYEFYGEKGLAKIIAFSRESLIKDDVLVTIDKVNKGLQKDRINPSELMKKSHVCFVLVRGNE